MKAAHKGKHHHHGHNHHHHHHSSLSSAAPNSHSSTPSSSSSSMTTTAKPNAWNRPLQHQTRRAASSSSSSNSSSSVSASASSSSTTSTSTTTTSSTHGGGPPGLSMPLRKSKPSNSFHHQQQSSGAVNSTRTTGKGGGGSSSSSFPSTNAKQDVGGIHSSVSHRGGGTTANNSTSSAAPIALRARYLHLLLTLTGQTVTVTMQDGGRYTGILHTATPFPNLRTPENRLKYVLKAVTVDREPATTNNSNHGRPAVRPGQTVVVDMDQVVDLWVKAAKLDGLSGSTGKNPPPPSPVVSRNHASSGGLSNFQTDSEISSAPSKGADRALVQAGSVWTSAAGSTGSLNSRAEGLLEPGSKPSGSNKLSSTSNSSSGLQGSIGGWDQFKANEELFNVKSSYDENLYTTALDKTAISADKVQAAERLAREIESATASNIHVAEERGQAVENDFDEEDKYSGVIRGIGSRNSATPRSPTSKSSSSGGGVSTTSSGASTLSRSPSKRMNYAAVAAATPEAEVAGAPPGFSPSASEVTSSTESSASTPSAAPSQTPTTDVDGVDGIEITEKEATDATKTDITPLMDDVKAAESATSDETATGPSLSTKESEIVSIPATTEASESRALLPTVLSSEISSEPSAPTDTVETPVVEKTAAAVEKDLVEKAAEVTSSSVAEDVVVTSPDDSVNIVLPEGPSEPEDSSQLKGEKADKVSETESITTAAEEKVEEVKPSGTTVKRELVKSASKLNAKAKTFTPGGFGSAPKVMPPVEPQQQQHPIPHMHQQQQQQHYAIDPNTGMPLVGAPHIPAPQYLQSGPLGQPGMVMMNPQYPGMRYPAPYPGMEQHMPPPMMGQPHPVPPPQPQQSASAHTSAAPSPVPASSEEDMSLLTSQQQAQQQQQPLHEGDSTSSGPPTIQQPPHQGPMQPPQQPPMPMPYGMPPANYYGGQIAAMQQRGPGGYQVQQFGPQQIPMIRPLYTVPGAGMPQNVMRGPTGMPYYSNPGAGAHMPYPPYGGGGGYDDDVGFRGGRGGRGRGGRGGRGRGGRSRGGGAGRYNNNNNSGSNNNHHHHHHSNSSNSSNSNSSNPAHNNNNNNNHGGGGGSGNNNNHYGTHPGQQQQHPGGVSGGAGKIDRLPPSVDTGGGGSSGEGSNPPQPPQQPPPPPPPPPSGAGAGPDQQSSTSSFSKTAVS